MPQMPSVTLGVWIGNGSGDEVTGEEGISHFIEHLLFKGSATRSAKQISEEIDQIGGSLNAFTSREATCYYVKVLAEDLPLAVDILLEMVFEPAFPKEEIEREKNVIFEEIKMYDDTPDELVHDLFHREIWKNHPLGKPVIGDRDAILAMTREDIVAFYRRHYTNNKIVIAAAGKIKHDYFLELVHQKIDKIETTNIKGLSEVPEWHPGRYNIIKDTEQAHLCVGSAGAARFDKDYYVFQLISALLGSGTSSRLFQKIREERGLAYSVFSYSSSYNAAGIFVVYAGTAYENLAKVYDMIMQELVNISSTPVSPEELGKVKQQLRNGLLMSMETTSARMNRLGKSELFYDRVILVDEVIRNIARVKIADIQRVAEVYFQSDKLASLTLGKQGL
jgi:predicted Zn-dependent peptidase